MYVIAFIVMALAVVLMCIDNWHWWAIWQWSSKYTTRAF